MQANISSALANQWLQTKNWHDAFPAISTWFDYGLALPESVLNRLCAAPLGQAPMRAAVEQPWQAQWVLRQCEAYLQQAGRVAPLPHVQTLGQWVQTQAQASTTDILTARQAALMLCGSLKALNVDSIHSDGARYKLAGEMVALMAELDCRVHLDKAIPFAGQDAHNRLSQTPWLSREASWLAAAQGSVDAADKPSAWQQSLLALQTLASDDKFVMVLPAPHPSLMMQAFLSAVNEVVNKAESELDAQTTPLLAVGLPQLCDVDHSAHALSNVQVLACDSFEHEAQTAAALVVQAMSAAQANAVDGTTEPNQTTQITQTVTIVAHDRVLARRVAALLARRSIAVEDRVGWALSTTVAATTARSIVSSWQGNDPHALMAWLALPVVAQHWPGAPATLAHLRRLWHAQAIVPDNSTFMAYALKSAASHDNAQNAAVQTCLQQWHTVRQHFVQPSKPMTVGIYAHALLAYLKPLQAVLQQDAAGDKVWQQLSALGLETESTPVTLATFAAVLDEAFESERFSASSANHASSVAKAVFVPLYEAAWTDAPSIIMVGCNESHLPAKPRSPTPLLASVRRELGLPTPTHERAVWQHLLASISAKQQTVFATYTPSEQGNPSRLSPWLLGANETGKHKNTTNTNIANVSIANGLSATDSATLADTPDMESVAQLGVSAMPSEISVTKLAEIVQCPYRFAMRSIYGIQALDEPSLWPSHLERGNLLHEALHAVQGDLRTLNDPATLHRAIDSALHTVVQNKLGLSGRYAALLADTQRTVSTYIATHTARQQEGWRLHATEKALASHSILDAVRVYGKLDRIDVIRDATGQAQGYAVLDYKTSSEQTLKEKRDAPLHDAQLALYAALLEHQDVPATSDNPAEHDSGTATDGIKDNPTDTALHGEPAAQAAYWRLHDGLHSAASSDAQASSYHDKHTLFSLTDVPTQVSQVTDAVRLAWHNLDTSGAAPATASESACQYCAYQGVCRASDLSLTINDNDTAEASASNTAGDFS